MPNRSSNWPMALQSASTVRAWVFRSIALSLAKIWFIGVEVRAVGRQVPDCRASSLNRCLNAGDFMGAQVIHHHDVAGPQFGHEKLFNPGAKSRSIDGVVQHQRRAQPVCAQRADKGRGAPVAGGRKAPAALTPGRAAPRRCHVCCRPRLVKKDQPRRWQCGLLVRPVLAGLRDVGPCLLGGVQGDFLASVRTGLPSCTSLSCPPRCRAAHAPTGTARAARPRARAGTAARDCIARPYSAHISLAPGHLAQHPRRGQHPVAQILPIRLPFSPRHDECPPNRAWVCVFCLGFPCRLERMCSSYTEKLRGWTLM